MYGSALAALLASYPEDVVRAVTDPVRGLPSTSQWLPTIAEVRSACEARLEPMRRQADRERRYAETYALLPPPPPDPPEARSAFVEQRMREIRPAITGKAGDKSLEEVRADAQKRLGELYRDRDRQSPVSPALAAKLAEIRADHARHPEPDAR